MCMQHYVSFLLQISIWVWCVDSLCRVYAHWYSCRVVSCWNMGLSIYCW
jgi:hypothetical protein